MNMVQINLANTTVLYIDPSEVAAVRDQSNIPNASTVIVLKSGATVAAAGTAAQVLAALGITVI
ncbi:MAG: hypothetical protein EBV03_11870 [Proteobacteria bacterium]|nr:hypothetical protein [Pseudomonadota bacterium]